MPLVGSGRFTSEPSPCRSKRKPKSRNSASVSAKSSTSGSCASAPNAARTSVAVARVSAKPRENSMLRPSAVCTRPLAEKESCSTVRVRTVSVPPKPVPLLAELLAESSGTRAAAGTSADGVSI